MACASELRIGRSALFSLASRRSDLLRSIPPPSLLPSRVPVSLSRAPLATPAAASDRWPSLLAVSWIVACLDSLPPILTALHRASVASLMSSPAPTGGMPLRQRLLSALLHLLHTSLRAARVHMPPYAGHVALSFALGCGAAAIYMQSGRRRWSTQQMRMHRATASVNNRHSTQQAIAAVIELNMRKQSSEGECCQSVIPQFPWRQRPSHELQSALISRRLLLSPTAAPLRCSVLRSTAPSSVCPSGPMLSVC